MKNILPFLQIIISILLILFILLQAKGAGLGSAWAGGGEFYRSRRGAEKLLFFSTIIVIALFFILSLLGLAAHS